MYISRVDGVHDVHIQYDWGKIPLKIKEGESLGTSDEVVVELAGRSKIMAWSSS